MEFHAVLTMQNKTVLKSESDLVKNENFKNFSYSPLLPLVFLTLSKLYSDRFCRQLFYSHSSCSGTIFFTGGLREKQWKI